MEIELRTRGQEFVAIVDLPPFQKMPDVVLWGSRVFAEEREHIHHGRPVYKEVFAFVSLTPSPGKPKDY